MLTGLRLHITAVGQLLADQQCNEAVGASHHAIREQVPNPDVRHRVPQEAGKRGDNLNQALSSKYVRVATKRLGLQCCMTDVGDIVVAHPAATLVIDLYPQSPEYLRMILPGILSPEASGHSLQTLTEACNRLTARRRLVKVTCTSDGTVNAMAEMLVSAPNLLPTTKHLQSILPTVIRFLLTIPEELRIELQLAGIAHASEE